MERDGVVGDRRASPSCVTDDDTLEASSQDGNSRLLWHLALNRTFVCDETRDSRRSSSRSRSRVSIFARAPDRRRKRSSANRRFVQEKPPVGG